MAAPKVDARFEIWSAPLVPPAIAATVGLLLDRYYGLSATAYFALAITGFGYWLLGRSRFSRTHLAGLWLVCLALAAAHHQQRRDRFTADDVGQFASEDAPFVYLRGVIIDGPTPRSATPRSALASMDRPDSSAGTLLVSTIRIGIDWRPCTGYARFTVPGQLDGVFTGDEVELVGWLATPPRPSNPGERDRSERMRDQHIRAVIRVRSPHDMTVRLRRAWPSSMTGQLAYVRNWGHQTLARNLPAEQAGLAAALILGEDESLPQENWDRYTRTGVVHVLAVSGQHLAVIATGLWWLFSSAGIPRQRGAIVTGVALFAYAMLTGFRPPMSRAAIVFAMSSMGVALHRPVMPANAFALSWLAIIVLNPTDPFTAGCQLAFLLVFLLKWGAVTFWDPDGTDPLDKLVKAARPPWQNRVLSVVRPIGISYAVTGLLFLVTAPLVASWVHIISPSGVVIGPPMVLLTSLAIIAGFLMLVAELLGGFATPVIAMVLRWLLTACDKVVLWGDQLPLGHRYVSDIPMWWLWGLYLGLFALLWIKPIWDRRRWLGLCGAAWLCVGLLSGSLQPAPDELRCTFLSVGHGGCTILETPDGRTILYDAGSLAGPDVTQRFIAPYLWHRGTRRIDEVILSHADLDHFNALPSLLDRFSVGLVTFTPSFTAKASPGVQATMQALSTKGVPTRVVSAGDVLNAGQVRMEVLHPPAIGPDGIENVRSLVLRVRHAGHSILLTGDLQEPALSQVMARKTEPIDVLMAPHHGSRTSNTPALAKWANPRLVVICQSAPRSTSPASDPYAIAGARVMSTWRDGAVTISSHSTGLIAEGFRGGERVVVRHGSSRPQKE